MSGMPMKIGKQTRGKSRWMRDLKREATRWMRRQAKKITHPDTDTHPKRGFLGIE